MYSLTSCCVQNNHGVDYGFRSVRGPKLEMHNDVFYEVSPTLLSQHFHFR